jgi:replication factor C small subunit
MLYRSWRDKVENTLWNEKYRPMTLDEVIGQSSAVADFKGLVKKIHEGKSELPHILLYGKPGVGKTTLALAFLRSAFGDAWITNYHNLNASTDGSVDTVRTKISDWVKQSTMGYYTTSEGKERSLPFNIIFMDEFDYGSTNYQAALRVVMEKYSDNTRFIISCNYVHKVLEPIRDRCLNIRCSPLLDSDIEEIIKRIAKTEGLTITSGAIKKIARESGGSARRCQNLLYQASLRGEKIKEEDISVSVKSFDMNKFYKAITANATNDMKEYTDSYKDFDVYINNLVREGFTGSEIVEMIAKGVEEDNALEPANKRYLFKSLGEAMYKGGFVNDDALFIKLFVRGLG